MDEMWGPVIGSLGFTLLVVGTYITNRIIKYKLEVARINSETTVKAEEIRCRNQFELDRYISQQESASSTISAGNSNSDRYSSSAGNSNSAGYNNSVNITNNASSANNTSSAGYNDAGDENFDDKTKDRVRI